VREAAAARPELGTVPVASHNHAEMWVARAAPAPNAPRVIGWVILIAAIGAGYLAYTRYGHLRPVAPATTTVNSISPNSQSAATKSPAGSHSGGAPSTPDAGSNRSRVGISPPVTAPAPSPSSASPPAAAPAPPAATPAPPAAASPSPAEAPATSPKPTSPAPPVHPAKPSSAAALPRGSATPQAAGVDVVRVAVVATDRAWLRVVVDGHAVYDGSLGAGERRTWEAHHQVILSTTNAGALEVAANGRLIGRLGNPDEVTERSFAPSPTSSP
jgi:hypothetical protein